MVKWQTRSLEVAILATEWRFKSSRAHQNFTGGHVPDFQKGGKVWDTLNQLKKHIALVKHMLWNETYTHHVPGSWAYDDTEVVEFEMNVKSVTPTKDYR